MRRGTLTRVILSLSIAQGTPQTGRTPSLVIARRPQADKAIPIWSIGDCFAGARSDKIGVISERVIPARVTKNN